MGLKVLTEGSQKGTAKQMDLTLPCIHGSTSAFNPMCLVHPKITVLVSNSGKKIMC